MAVLMNVGGSVCLIKLAKQTVHVHENTTDTKRTDARRRVCAAIICTAEPFEERRYENWITTTTTRIMIQYCYSRTGLKGSLY